MDRALVEAGVDRKRIYVTNAVKHFKFEPRGEAVAQAAQHQRDQDNADVGFLTK